MDDLSQLALAHLHGRMGSCSTEPSRCPHHTCRCYHGTWAGDGAGDKNRDRMATLWEQAETGCPVLSFNDAPGTGCQMSLLGPPGPSDLHSSLTAAQCQPCQALGHSAGTPADRAWWGQWVPSGQPGPMGLQWVRKQTLKSPHKVLWDQALCS